MAKTWLWHGDPVSEAGKHIGERCHLLRAWGRALAGSWQKTDGTIRGVTGGISTKGTLYEGVSRVKETHQEWELRGTQCSRKPL